MTPEMLMALMLTMKCHSLIVDIPERRETIAKTVCVRVQPVESKPEPVQVAQVEKSKPVVEKAKPTKKKKRRRRRRR